MIHKIESFLKKVDFENIDKIKSRMIQFDGRKTAGKFAAAVKNTNSYHVPTLDGANIDKQADKALTQQLVHSVFTESNNELLTKKYIGSEFIILDCRIIEYKKSQEYGWHLDFTVSQSPISNGIKTNKISFVIFLSDPSDYNGGELEINTGDEIKSIKENKGTMVIYPSNTLHRVNKVTKGKRLVIIGWIYCIYENPFDRHIICSNNQSLDLLFKFLNNKRRISKVEWDYIFNNYMQLHSAFKRKSLTNH